MKKLTIIFLTMMLLIFLVGRVAGSKKGPITIGTKGFTQQRILGNLMRILLEEHSYKVNYRPDLTGPSLRRSLVTGKIDLYMEYPATVWFLYLLKPAILLPDELYKQLKKEDLQKNALLWLEPTGFKNSYALAMREKQAKELGIKTISDLASYVNKHPKKISLTVDSMFFVRADGLAGVESKYNFTFHRPQVRSVLMGLTYGLLNSKVVDVAAVLTADPQVEEFGFTILKDDKDFFLTYNLAPVIRKEVANRYPQVVKLLNELRVSISEKAMHQLTTCVRKEKVEESLVAKKFLIEQGLIGEKK